MTTSQLVTQIENHVAIHGTAQEPIYIQIGDSHIPVESLHKEGNKLIIIPTIYRINAKEELR